jgi:hypothetical protein
MGMRQIQHRLFRAASHSHRQEIHLAPWVLVLGSVSAGAALFAAAVAFVKVFL